MNKIKIMAGMALALTAGLAATSCKDDTQPRLDAAEEGSFVLYEPANNNYVYELTDESTITLTTNGQPDYGVAAVTNYQVQISLDGTWKEEVTDPATGDVTEYATYYVLPTIGTQSVINAKGSEIAKGMCVLMGVRQEEDVDKYKDDVCPLYVRVRAYINDPASSNGILSYSEIYSNVMKINYVQPMLVVPVIGKIWMIGTYQGWDINGGGNTLMLTEEENGIGSDVYTGYYFWDHTPAAEGDVDYIRFYSALGNWDENSIGSAAAEENVTINLSDQPDGTFAWIGSCYYSKGNWIIGNFPEGGGWMKATVDLKAMKVAFEYLSDYNP